MFRTLRHLIGAAILAFLTVAAVMLARFAAPLWFSFYTDFSRKAIRAVASVTALVPVPIWEILLVLLVLSIPIGLICAISKKKVVGWVTGVVEFAVFLVFLFVGVWGLNYYAPDIGSQIGLRVEEYDTDDLRQAAAYYAEQASACAAQVERDEDGNVILPEFARISDLAVEAYDSLGRTEPRFNGVIRSAKPLLVSEAFAYTGTSGVFVCLTGEATVSTATFPVSLPFTVAHELGHSLAVAPEDQANYSAFLACRASGDPLLRYSGYYSAFVYCFNALYHTDRTAAGKLWDLCSPQLIEDCKRHTAFNEQYEGKVQDTAQTVNDTYLKAFNQKDGVKSYGLVVDYLIADYLKNK